MTLADLHAVNACLNGLSALRVEGHWCYHGTLVQSGSGGVGKEGFTVAQSRGLVAMTLNLK